MKTYVSDRGGVLHQVGAAMLWAVLVAGLIAAPWLVGLGHMGWGALVLGATLALAGVTSINERHSRRHAALDAYADREISRAEQFRLAVTQRPTRSLVAASEKRHR